MENFNINYFYDEFVSHFPNHKVHPLIGIVGNFGEQGCELAEAYYKSVEYAGGIPYIIPPTENVDLLAGILDHIDGLLISGGADINPLYLGEEPIAELHGINPERDFMELMLVRLAYDRGIPMLGICRGLQAIVAALGGSLYQDLAACLPSQHILKHTQQAPRHTPTHSVTAEPDSIIAKVLGETFAVNSFHHQGVRDAGPKLRITARAADGVVEAVESNEFKSIVGVQWHPEAFIMKANRVMIPLFQYFTGEADSYRRAREVHSRILTLDSHCDTPMHFHKGIHIARRCPEVCVDLHKMSEGGLDAAVMAAYLPQSSRTEQALRAATAYADTLLEQIRQQVRSSVGVALAQSAKGVYQQKTYGRRAILLGIENGYAIGRDLSNIERYRREGVVYITLCHNGDNDICDSARGCNTHNGLSKFGREVIAAMNGLGIMIDLSHAAETSFYQALEASSAPIVCSHSNCRALCNHPRNLTDDQMRALAAAGGVMQLTLYHGFLKLPDAHVSKVGIVGSPVPSDADITDFIRHLEHAVSVMGIDHVGIGTDFDGDGGIKGLRDASELVNLTETLMRHGFSQQDISKIWGHNWLRVMAKIQGMADVTP